jgi:hypothetical protein
MSTKEWIGLVGLALPVIGWFITSSLQSAREVRQQRIAAVIDHTREQLEELYGPLLTLLIEGEQAWQACLRSFGRDPTDPHASEWMQNLLEGRDPGGRSLSQEEIDGWVFWIEHAFFPRNDRIQELLASKAHLIEGPPDEWIIPRSYTQFLEHHNGWKLRHLQWEKQGRPYPWCWTTSWPDSFFGEVRTTYNTLAQRHNEFLKAQRTDGLIEGGFHVPERSHPTLAEARAAS